MEPGGSSLRVMRGLYFFMGTQIEWHNHKSLGTTFLGVDFEPASSKTLRIEEP